MINRNKLEHILEYAKQQRHIGQSCKVPPEDMVEIMDRLLNAGKSPVISDKWIPVSERLPDESTGVLVCCEMDGPGDWRMKWATRVPNHPDVRDGDGWLIPGASWTPTHWMPLPAPPTEVK